MKIFIRTQVEENYGAHDWNGEGECPQYWKYKGGDNYVARNVTVEQAQDPAIWTDLEYRVTADDDHYQEYVIESILLDDRDPLPIEKWERVKTLTI